MWCAQERIHFAPVKTSAMCELRFSPDNAKVLLGGFDRILVYDVKQGEFAAPILVGFDPAAVKSAAPKEKGHIVDIRPDFGPPSATAAEIQSSERLVTSFDISPDSKRVAIGGLHGICSLWSTEAHQKLAEFGERSDKPDEIKQTTISPDGKWVAYFLAGTLHIVSLNNLPPLPAPATAEKKAG